MRLHPAMGYLTHFHPHGGKVLGVGVQSWSWRAAELGVGGGGKVRASGYGVFAEVPRGGAFGHRRRPPFLGTGPTIGRKIKGLMGSVPNFRGQGSVAIAPIEKGDSFKMTIG